MSDTPTGSASTPVSPAAAGARLVAANDSWTFDGASKAAFAVPTGSGRSASEIGTIEFWIQPTWGADAAPGDRIVMTLGSALTIAITSEMDQLVVNGRQIPIAFKNGSVHVALLPRTGDVFAMQEYVDTVDPVDTDISLDRLDVGGDGSHGFVGSIGGIRIWDTELAVAQLRATASQSALSPTAPTPEALPDLLPNTPQWPLICFSAPGGLAYAPHAGPWMARKHIGAVPAQAKVTGLDDTAHGYYECPVHLAFAYDSTANRRVAIASDGSSWNVVGDTTDPNRMTLIDQSGALAAAITLANAASTVRITESATDALAATSYVRTAARVENAGQNWNNAFSNQAANLQFNLLGWDSRRGDPPPRIRNTGTSQFIFEEPSGKSTNFVMKRIEKGDYVALPLGLQYAPRSSSEMTARTSHICNSYEHKKSTSWGHELKSADDFELGPLSANVGVEFNQHFQQTATNMASSDRSAATSSVTVAKYALVLDKINIELSGGFRSMVEELVAGGDLSDFFDMYGTHYAHAITYGGRATRTATMTKSTQKSLIEQGHDISQAVNFGFGIALGDSKKHEGVGAKNSTSLKSDQSDQTSDTAESVLGNDLEDVKAWGSVDAVGGIHDGDSNELPVFVDLRPISELLGPPFFLDHHIAVDLRRRMEIELAEMFTGKPVSWGSYFVEILGVAGPEAHRMSFGSNPPREYRADQLGVGVAMLGKDAYEPIAWRGRNGNMPPAAVSSRMLSDCRTHPYRCIVPAGATEFAFALWPTDDSDAKRWTRISFARLPRGDEPREPLGAVTSTTEIYRNALLSVRVVPSHVVLSGGWAIDTNEGV